MIPAPWRGFSPRADSRATSWHTATGQSSSRDARYGRAIARKLGYRHVAIPPPTDFVTHRLEEDAWLFDAEWSAELHWAVRFAYRDPRLGDTSGHHGGDLFSARRKLGDAPLAVVLLRNGYSQLYQE